MIDELKFQTYQQDEIRNFVIMNQLIIHHS